jgi:hypothetical protein
MGYDSTPTTRYVYTCPHTGEQFESYSMADARALASSLSPNCEGALLPNTVSVITGLQSSQIGSQSYLNAVPPEQLAAAQTYLYSPVDALKTAEGSATYAAGWLGTYTSTIPASVVAGNDSIVAMQKYPVSVGTAEIWKAIPQIAPITYAQRNAVALVPGSVNFNQPSGSPGSVNEPSYVRSLASDEALNHGDAVGTMSTAGVGAGGTSGSSVISNAVSAIKTAPVLLAVVIVTGLLLIFMMGKGIAGRAG